MDRDAGPRRGLAPYFGVVFFLLHVAIALGRAGDALRDPGVGWHLRAGHLMLDAGAVLREDPFSWTAAERPWLNYYWLFEIASAALERAGGLPLVAAGWMLAYAAIPVVLYRNVVRAGATPLAALLVVPLAHVVLLSHAIARPHVVTYLAFAVLLGRLADVESERRPPAALWWLPLLALVWANAHGGFVAGLAATGIVAAATLARAVATGDATARRLAPAFGLVFAAMTLATLANPWGPELHRQAIEHVSAPSTARFHEFQPPDLRSGGASVRAFALLAVAALGLVAGRLARPGWSGAALLVATLGLALASARNMNLFVLVAAPVVATGLTNALARALPALHRRWLAIGAAQEASSRAWPWLSAASAAVLALAVAGRLPFPTSLDGLQVSAGAMAFLAAHPERYERPFNTDALGGSLVYRFWPRLRVFVDDRTPVYGEAFMAEYFTVFDAAPGWQEALDRRGVTAAIVGAGTPIAPVLRASPGWATDYADARTVLLLRTAAPPAAP